MLTLKEHLLPRRAALISDNIDWDRVEKHRVDSLFSYMEAWNDQNKVTLERRAAYLTSVGTVTSISIILAVACVMLDSYARVALWAVLTSQAARLVFLYAKHRTSAKDRKVFEDELTDVVLDMAKEHPLTKVTPSC